MADLKIQFDDMLVQRKGQAALPTAVVHPCDEDALVGTVEAVAPLSWRVEDLGLKYLV